VNQRRFVRNLVLATTALGGLVIFGLVSMVLWAWFGDFGLFLIVLLFLTLIIVPLCAAEAGWEPRAMVERLEAFIDRLFDEYW
jgi:hypothetical protein